VGGCGLGAFISGESPVTGSCERGNEPTGSIKGKVFFVCIAEYILYT
jgi:hypothetical protein